jgi:hypothetical protein
MTLLQLLKDRFTQAEKFTKKKYIDDVTRSVEDYEAREMNLTEVVKSSGMDAINKRYEFVIPLIFTNTEAMKSSLWDRLPDLIFKGRGAQDDDKKRKVEAAYEYLKDKLDLESFAVNASHWFILTGFVSAHASFKSEAYDVPMYDELGQPILDPLTGQPQMQTLYSYNDPVLELSDPEKEYFSAEAEFSVDAKGVPFQFRKKLMTVEEIKRIYDVKVEPDAQLDIEGYNKESDAEVADDTKRATVYFYYGSIPEELKEEVEDWQPGAEYYIIYTSKKILYKERRDERLCRLAKWYGTPNSFFGFGLGKIGRQFQKEKSIRRGQQIRLADVAAFPKYAIKNDGVNNINLKDLLDPRAEVVILYESEAPQILQPGNLAQVVTAAEESADRDAQQAFGLMDLSSGAQQSSTVDTATGQTIFAEAAEKRVRFAKKTFMKFYQSVVIMLLKLAQENWDETKLITITDEEGNDVDVQVSREDLSDINFDTDIEIDAESASVNKDVEREQYISLYDKTKDDPIINRRPLFQDMVRYGFKIRSPERYMRELDLPPGTILMDQQGNQYIIDKTGDLVTPEAAAEMATPSGEEAPQSEGAVLGGVR